MYYFTSAKNLSQFILKIILIYKCAQEHNNCILYGCPDNFILPIYTLGYCEKYCESKLSFKNTAQCLQWGNNIDRVPWTLQ